MKRNNLFAYIVIITMLNIYTGEDLFAAHQCNEIFVDAYSKDFVIELSNKWNSIKQSFGSVPKEQKESLINQYKSDYRNYKSILENHLESLGIEYEWRVVSHNEFQSLVEKNEILFIKPSQNSWLNQQAHILKSVFNVDLVYDPLASSQILGEAYYKDRILYANFELAMSANPKPIEKFIFGHEIWHVLFDAFRSGILTQGYPRADYPVYYIFKGTHGFYFEEIPAHGFSLKYLALNYNQAPGEEKSELINKMMNSYKLILEYSNGSLQIMKELKKSISEKKFELHKINGQNWAFISDSLMVFIPPNMLTSYRKSPEQYLLKQVAIMNKLSVFTQSYFKNVNLNVDKFLQASAEFQDAFFVYADKLNSEK